MQVPETERAADSHSKTRALTEVLSRATDFYRTQLKDSPIAIDYLKRRGVTGQTAARFALGYAPDAWQPLRAAFDNYDDPQMVEAGLVISDEGKRYDRFRGRVMFPIRNARGQVIGFGARILDAGEPKYLNSPETPIFRKGPRAVRAARGTRRDSQKRSRDRGRGIHGCHPARAGGLRRIGGSARHRHHQCARQCTFQSGRSRDFRFRR